MYKCTFTYEVHSFTFKPRSIEDAETVGDDTIEYSISAYLSTLASTVGGQKVISVNSISETE